MSEEDVEAVIVRLFERYLATLDDSIPIALCATRHELAASVLSDFGAWISSASGCSHADHHTLVREGEGWKCTVCKRVWP